MRKAIFTIVKYTQKIEGGHNMNTGHFTVPEPINEPAKGYLPGSPERASLKAELERQSQTVVEIPIIIGGKSIRRAIWEPS